MSGGTRTSGLIDMDNQRECAVVFMDVVGYTRLMSMDEAGTHARFNEIKDETVAPIAKNYAGDIKRLLGDSILIQFDKACDAISFAIEFQNHIARETADADPETNMLFRVGGNIGPVFDSTLR